MVGRANEPGNPGTQAVVMEAYDATAIVGLRVRVMGAAIQRTAADGDVSVEIPRLRELMASAAVCRCLRPLKLRGWELRAIRKIMGCTLADLAKKMDARTAVETISRWEKETQPIGGYAEKVLRLLVCEELRKEAPGVAYEASMIANLRVLDPWILDKGFEVPAVEFHQVRLKQTSGDVVDAWEKQAA